MERALFVVALVCIAFIAGNQCATVPIEYREVTKVDTVWMQVNEPMRSIPLPNPEVRVVEVYDTLYTYKDSVRIQDRFFIPYSISARGPVTDFQLGLSGEFPNIFTTKTRYVQPRGVYIGGAVGHVPSVGATYVRNNWAFSYDYQFQFGHSVGVKYRIIK